MFPELFRNCPFLPLGTSNRLTLRPLQKSDAEKLATLANNKNVAERLARLPHPYTLADAYAFITFAEQGISSGKYLLLAIERRVDKTLMGVIGCEGQNELGYWLGEEFWGQGYGKEAAREFVQFLFTIFEIDKIIGSVKETNTASRRIFEGLGFCETGTKECESLAFEGTHPGVTYALTREGFSLHYKKKGRPTVKAVIAVLINEEGEILLAERPEGKAAAGIWEPCGGKIEPGETPEEAIVRELKEEIGISVAQQDLELFSTVSYPYDSYQLSMTCYLCRWWTGEPYGAEGQKVVWRSWKDLTTLPLFPASVLPFLKIRKILEREI